MPKFKLTSPHYLRDSLGNFVYLGEGTVVGDGCAIPFTGRPSLNMDGADAAGEAAVKKRMEGTLLPVESIPIKGAV